MLAYITAQLPYVFYRQPTCINANAIKRSDRLKNADTSTILSVLRLHIIQLNEILICHHKDNEFITQVISIIGIDRYNEQVEYIIDNFTDDKSDKSVIIDALVSFTDITKLNVVISDKPFLGHLYE